jgi:regulator of replication initiation timing
MSPDDVKALHAKMDEVIKSNQALAIENARLAEKVEANCDQFDALHKDYFGNGDGGTRRDVTTMKAQMGWIIKIVGGVVTTVLATLAIAILDVVKY